LDKEIIFYEAMPSAFEIADDVGGDDGGGELCKEEKENYSG